jgi:hypothetical protein
MAARKRASDTSSQCPAPLRSPAPPPSDGLDAVTSAHAEGDAALHDAVGSRSPPPCADDAALHDESLPAKRARLGASILDTTRASHARRARAAAKKKRRADRERARRARAHAALAAGVTSLRAPLVVRVVELAAGIGGGRVAAELAAEALCALGHSVAVKVVHASDLDAGKVDLYNASAAVRGGAFTRAVAADICDERAFSAARIAAWGDVSLIVSCILCESVSSCGSRRGLAAIAPYITSSWCPSSV